MKCVLGVIDVLSWSFNIAKKGNENPLALKKLKRFDALMRLLFCVFRHISFELHCKSFFEIIFYILTTVEMIYRIT